jgi:putative CocE/NonD family hydrolase
MRFLPLVMFAALLEVGSAQVNADYQIFFNGTPAGSCKWTLNPDGSFASSVELHIATTTIKSTSKGQFKGEKLIDSQSSTTSPTATGTITYAGGIVKATAGGKTKEFKYTPKADIYGSSLQPALWASAAKEALKELKGTPAGSLKAIQVFLIDAGSERTVDFRLLPSKTIQINGSAITASRLQASVAGTQMEFDTDSSGNVVALDVPSQKIRMVERGWVALFVDPLAAFPELSQPIFKTKLLANVKVPMRDGVSLATDLTMPDAPGKYPAVLIRTPYGRAGEDLNGDFYAKRGYVVVCQDCRGKGDSAGKWDPFVYEGDDGYDAIQWIAKQPWSTGKVGMIGGSYVGYVQWAAAVKHPPALKCIVPQVSPPDAMHNLPYDFGIPFLYGDIWWAKIVAGKGVDMSSFKAPLPNPDGLLALPLDAVDKAALKETIPFYHDWLRRTTEKDWKGWDFLAHMKQADVPALHISGWWDGDGIGTKLNWAAERALGRKDQWLIYGPWSHAFNSASAIGKVDYGSSAILELDSLYLRWFDTWLKGKSVGMDKVPHVRVFVTGANRWVDLPDWPSDTESVETLYLDQDPTAQHDVAPLVTKGLSIEMPGPGEVVYTYDPAKDTDVSALKKGADAVDEFTGEMEMKGSNVPTIEFRSQPMPADTAIAGPATVDLYFKSSAKDTDFYATLVDIDEAGKSHVFGQPGKIRASYRDGVDKVVPLVPGRVTHVEILPWDFAHEIKKGHRIGLVIVPSGFPLYARNLGTIGPVATNKSLVAQLNSLLFGPDTPSRVTFHVLWPK